MKILVLSINFPSSAAPTQGVFVKERLRYLATHCKIKVISPVPWFPLLRYFKRNSANPVPAFEVIDGFEVWHPRFFYIPLVFKCLDGFFLFLSVLLTVKKIRKFFPFDLIDAHFAYPDGFAGVLLGKLFHVPVSVTLRGTIVPLSLFHIRRSLIQWTLNRATYLFAVAEFLKSIAILIGVPGKTIRVIPNGVDSGTFFPMDRVKARQNLKLPERGKILISVGSLIEHKGYHRIINVLPELLKEFPSLVYVIIGGASSAGDYSAELRQLVMKLGLEQHVWFAGPKYHRELREWLSAADLFCLATKCEGWANVFLEAMACGLPVVATDVGGNREIIVSEEVGYLVPYGDSEGLKGAICKALDKTWDKEGIVSYARQYSWEDAASRIISIYQGRDLTS